jgi:hypothetical protein
MAAFSSDPFHPDRLRCETCGQVVAVLPEGCRAPSYALTASLAGVLWPDLAEDVANHAGSCPGVRQGVVRVRIVG